MGTPDFAVPCLKALVDSGYDVCGVVSQPDRPKGRGRKLSPSPVKEAALALGLNVVTVERVKEPAFLTQLENWAPDVSVVVAFGQILPESVLRMPRFGCINVHASLLPSYRGAAPIHWAVINGEKKTGVTTMQMDRGMDTGAMLMSDSMEIGLEMTMGELHDALAAKGAVLIMETLEQVFSGKLTPVAQDEKQASYAPMLKRSMEKIDWTKSATEIHNLIRGMNPWPGAYCVCDAITMKIWRSRIVDGEDSLVPGRIHSVTSSGLVVESGKGRLELLEVQPECKRRMGAKECACGYCIVPGTVLG